ncbi:MAG: hypothetical protein ACYC5A_04135 [Thermoleophilia bacterium]
MNQPPAALEAHREELIEVLRDLEKVSQEKPYKRFPSRFSPWVWHELTGQPVNEWCQANVSINHSLRQIHDFYGWMAKRGKWGHCAGALYRTRAYLDISQDQRNGTQKSGNVHIEHAIPVNTLECILFAEHAELCDPVDLHDTLIRNSICVAMTVTEKEAMEDVGVDPSWNDAFDSEGRHLHNSPFHRYLPLRDGLCTPKDQFEVWNITRRMPVDLEGFTFDDHLATLREASSMALGSEVPFVYSLSLFPREQWAVL